MGVRERPFPLGDIPWVTAGLTLICLTVFLALPARELPVEDDRLSGAVEYWKEHVYLEAEPEVVLQALADVPFGERRARLDALLLDSYRQWATQPEIRAERQSELDRLTAEALAPAAATPPDPLRRWGLVPGETRLLPLLTHPFLHAGWVQLIGNLLFLGILGTLLEQRWRALLFAGALLAGSVIAGGGSLLFTGSAGAPVVGTAGMLSVLLAALLVARHGDEIPVPMPVRSDRKLCVRVRSVPLLWIAPLWMVHECVQVLCLAEGTAYWGGHFGGLAAGAVFALAVKHWELDRHLRRSTAPTEPPVSVLEQARTALENGAAGQAFALLRAEVQRNREDPETILAFWDAAVAFEREEFAAPCMLRLVSRCVERREMRLAAEHWKRVMERLPDELAEPEALVRLAPALVLLDDKAHAVAALRHAIHPRNAGLTATVAMQALRLADELEPSLSVEAARRALGCPLLTDADRARCRELVGEPEAETASPPAAASSAAVPRFPGKKIVEGTPELLGADGVVVRTADGRSVEVPYAQVEALASARVGGLGDAPVALIDLALNWREIGEAPLRVIRLRADRFDAHALVEGAETVETAWRKLLETLRTRTRAVRLPDAESSTTEAPAAYPDLETYEHEVLGIGS